VTESAAKPGRLKLWFAGGDSARAARPFHRIPEIAAFLESAAGVAFLASGVSDPVSQGGVIMTGGMLLALAAADIEIAVRERRACKIRQSLKP
jgi:hypothetical protein